MIYPYSKQVVPYCFWENTFTNDELNYLQNEALESKQKAKVGDSQNLKEIHEIRRSKISWIEYSKENDWLFKKLSHVVSSLNSQFYGFDLTGFGEPIQLTNYDGIDNGMYGWHQDYGSNQISRKLSLVLQLTDPSEYEGGNLQMFSDGGKILNIKKQRGLIVVFPSYQYHQVTPVSQGKRQSLVAWISGPFFR